MKRSWSAINGTWFPGPGAFRTAFGGMAAGNTSQLRRPYDVVRGVDAELSQSDVPDVKSDEPECSRIRQMRLEAVLLLSKNSLTPRKLAQLAHLADATEARTLVRQLNRIYDELGRAIRVEQVAGGYRMLTRPSLAPWLTRLGHLPSPIRLSTPMMETLAVVAYRQPVSRASAEAIRGVACGELLRQLMERDLIRIAGRGEELGRPYLYGTTKKFLQIFGLSNLELLPPIEWQTLQDDDPTDSTSEDFSTSTTKEPVVSTSVASALSETEAKLGPIVLPVGSPLGDNPIVSTPAAVIEDEEDDLYENDDDEDDDDWDDDDDDDWDDDEDDEDDEDDDELEDEWEEVDDEDDIENDVDEDEEDEFDDEADDDEEWDEESDEDEDDEDWD